MFAPSPPLRLHLHNCVTDHRHKELLFTYKGCLRADRATCLPPSSPYYAVSHNGLDPMVQRLAKEASFMGMESPGSISAEQDRCVPPVMEGRG